MTISPNRQWALIVGPLLAIAVAVGMNQSGWEVQACWTGAVAILCVVWWIFEPIPIPATAIIPLAVFPLTGVLPQEKIAAAYGSELILLMLGGFILSAAMERSGAHRRIALGMVNVIGGTSSRRIVLGFMVATAALSMWISNTATTLMMLPIALAVITQSPDKKLALPLLLAIAYGSSIGGLGTPIGTPPNLVFMQQYESFTGTAVSFSQWMGWGLPVVADFFTTGRIMAHAQTGLSRRIGDSSCWRLAAGRASRADHLWFDRVGLDNASRTVRRLEHLVGSQRR